MSGGAKVRKILLKKMALLLGLLILIPAGIDAQRPSRKVRKAITKSEQREEDKKKAYDKAVVTDRKRRFRMQTPEVQERMKENRKHAREFNKGKKDPFLKRIFKKRRR